MDAINHHDQNEAAGWQAESTAIRIGVLTLPAPGFEVFTFPRYRPLLLGTEHPEHLPERVALGAWLGERPVGLAFFSRCYGDDARRQLFSVMVSRFLRRRGIGRRLLALGEQTAAAQGTRTLLAYYSSRLAARDAFEALLNRAGWSAPREFEYRLAGKAQWAYRAAQDWAPFLARLQQRGYAATLWGEITAADREQIAALVATVLTPEERQFDPLPAAGKLELLPDLSLILRREQEIVGWILGSRGALPDSVYYSHGYVLPSVRRAGWLVGGVRDVCQRQAEQLGGETVSVFETAHDNQAMRRFMERQLKPYSLWTDSRYRSEKEIGAAGTPAAPIREERSG